MNATHKTSDDFLVNHAYPSPGLIQERGREETGVSPYSTSVNGNDNKRIIHDRSNIFEGILVEHWHENLPSRISLFTKDSRGWITELKTRFLTNFLLTPEKIKSLVDLILWYENKIISRDSTNVLEGLGTERLKDFLSIQVYTREIEKHIAEIEGNPFLSYGLVVDFLRDVTSLQALGFRAPQINEIIHTMEKHPNLQFDDAILQKYRNAVHKSLLAFHWDRPAFLEGIHLNKEGNIDVIPTKGGRIIPASNFEATVLDEHARDYSLALFPPTIISAMSTFNRQVAYDLTRTKPPFTQQRKFFRRKQKPDFNRISPEQDELLQRMLTSS